MRQQKFVYNKQTLQYEAFKTPLRVKIVRALGITSTLIFTAAIFAVLIDVYLPSQKERALMREIDEMKYQYTLVEDQLDLMSEELSKIQNRDANVHRFVFDMDPIEESVWNAGIGGSDKYSDIGNYSNAGRTMVQTRKKVDLLMRQLEIQSHSLDTIELRAHSRADKLESIPSIKPVRVDLLKYDDVNMLSGYGMRIHPIHKVRKMHTGIDFTAPRGTAIQATGKGVVTSVRLSKSGYGRHVVVDHGFGYQSLYGHMNEIHVEVGDLVHKGQQIGTVGSTGTSTAPHCHYEVHYNGKAIDPVHYCLDGLTPSQYREIVDRASSASQSFD